MLQLISVQKINSPASIIRFSPDGTRLLVCSADKDEVTVWEVDQSARLTLGFRFSTREMRSSPFSEFIRDAAWVSNDRIILTGLARPIQVWAGIAKGEPQLDRESFPIDSNMRRDSTLNLLRRTDENLYVALARSGVTQYRLRDLSLVSRDDRSAGQAHIAEELPLVSCTFADQTCTSIMFGELSPMGKQSVDWFPLRLIQPGEAFGGIVSDPTQAKSALLHGVQGATITLLELPSLDILSTIDITSQSEAGTISPDDFCEYLVEDEALLCKPILQHGHLLYPSLSGKMVLIMHLFDEPQIYQIPQHARAITSMSIIDKVLAVSSFDSTISFWNISGLQHNESQQTSDSVLSQFRDLIAELRTTLATNNSRALFKKRIGQKWEYTAF